MSITEFHKLEQKFLRIFGFELDEPVQATLNIRDQSLKAIVIPEIDRHGIFSLAYYEADDDYSQPSGQPGVRKISESSRSVLDYAKADDDEVSLELCRRHPFGFPGQMCSEFNARVAHSDRSHKGSLYLYGGQIVVKGKEEYPLARAAFSLLNIPMLFDLCSDKCVELAAMGWRVVLSLDPEMTRGKHGYTGVVERCDKSSFTIEELDELLEILTWFFSYVAAGECFPTSVVGCDSQDREVFVRLLPLKLRRRYRPNWFDNSSWVKQGAILEYLFPRFCEAWRMHEQEVVEIVRAYLEAREAERHVSGRLALRVSYTGLEVLARLIGKNTMLKSEGRVDDVLAFYEIPHTTLCKSTEPRLHSTMREAEDSRFEWTSYVAYRP